MTRLLLSLCSAIILITAYFGLAGANASAAEDESILAPGNPPLTREVSDSSAQVTVFMLKVVASGTASVSDFSLDSDILDEWADAMAAEYTSMSDDEQQQLAIMPPLRNALLEAWPQASASEQASVRDAFRPIAQGWLADMSCAGFIGLADGGLVEKTQANVARYLSCDDESESMVAPVDEPAPVAAAPVRAASSTPTESPTAAYQRASAGLQASHNMYVNMSNVLLQNHVGNMNAILNMGNNNYRYVYKP
jgi:hypothetical protein